MEEITLQQMLINQKEENFITNIEKMLEKLKNKPKTDTYRVWNTMLEIEKYFNKDIRGL